jgi:hypothetical protein
LSKLGSGFKEDLWIAGIMRNLLFRDSVLFSSAGMGLRNTAAWQACITIDVNEGCDTGIRANRTPRQLKVSAARHACRNLEEVVQGADSRSVLDAQQRHFRFVIWRTSAISREEEVD